MGMLRRHAPREVVNTLWQAAMSGVHPQRRPCPACHHAMAAVPLGPASRADVLDICTRCQWIWFDSGEYERLPVKPAVPVASEPQLPQAAREKLALLRVAAIREEAQAQGGITPDEWWKWIPALLGMPVEHESSCLQRLPVVTWLLALAVAGVSLAALFGWPDLVSRFGLIPDRLWRYGGLTLLTSFFLHADLYHLVGNLYFLLVFGDNVEDYCGRTRYAWLILLACLGSGLAHTMGEPASFIPCIGASGGISGILLYFMLTFPHARLGILIRAGIWMRWLAIPAYAFFLFWLVLQVAGAGLQVGGYSPVSYLGHLGGAGVGVLFWLVEHAKTGRWPGRPAPDAKR